MSLGLRSGDVAAAAGVNRQTLRYYERRGCWQSRTEPRRASGYPPETVITLRVIKAAQRLGFTRSTRSPNCWTQAAVIVIVVRISVGVRRVSPLGRS